MMKLSVPYRLVQAAIPSRTVLLFGNFDSGVVGLSMLYVYIHHNPIAWSRRVC